MAFLRPDGYFYVSKTAGEFVESLLAEGHEIVFLQSFRRVGFDEELFAEYKLNYYDNIHYVTVERNIPKVLVYILLYIKGILSLFGVDFVYIFYPDNLAYIGLIGKILLRKKLGFYVRGSIGIYTVKSKFLYLSSDICCTVSPQITNFINNCSRSKKHIAHTISPMIDYGILEGLECDRESYEMRKIKNILFVGRITKDKGVNELFDSFVALHNTNVCFELFYVGDGPLLGELKEKAVSYGLSDYVHFYGHISSMSELQYFYKMADVLCLPSYHEGFPRVLYEAMLLKLPIVVTFVGTIPYLMHDKYNCIKINVCDVNSICEAIDALCKRPNLHHQIVVNAYSDVTRYLSENNLSHIELLHRFLKNG